MKRHLIALALAASASSSYALNLPGAVTDTDYYNDGQPAAAKIELGKQLFFDKVLSGNKNISCGTCHHPQFMSSDGISLSVGEGGAGLGTERTSGSGSNLPNDRIGRHSPHLFNLGAREFTRLNWQGRHQVLSNNQLSLPCKTPAIDACPTGLDNVLAGQNLFPLVNLPEMTGQSGENNVVDAGRNFKGVERFPPVWEAIVKRLRALPGYSSQFAAVFGLASPSQIKIQHVVNAMSAFESKAFRSDQSPFDAFLRGDTNALTSAQQRGMDLFYGSANCAFCHSGKFQTDHNFYAIAMPQFGPGVFVSGRSTDRRDIGRGEVTSAADNFKFRTPSLRNVEVTAPYGHTGAYATLEGVIRHHLDPVTSFNTWDRSQTNLMAPPTGAVWDDFNVMNSAAKSTEISSANQLAPSSLTDDQINDLIAFLGALTDANVANLGVWVPATVPSGLPVGD